MRTSENTLKAKFAQRVAPGKREIGAIAGIYERLLLPHHERLLLPHQLL
jgi:hypothetical protein